MGIKTIVTMGQNGVIGLKGGVPWIISEDLAHFRKITLGKTLVMGGKTFESILKYNHGNPLYLRDHIVLSSRENQDWGDIPSVTLCSDFRDIIKISIERDIYVIGGANIYEIFNKYTSELTITFIDKVYIGDSFFPDIDLNSFVLEDSKTLAPKVYIFKYKRKFGF